MKEQAKVAVAQHQYSGRWAVSVDGMIDSIFQTESEANAKADSLRAAQEPEGEQMPQETLDHVARDEAQQLTLDIMAMTCAGDHWTDQMKSSVQRRCNQAVRLAVRRAEESSALAASPSSAPDFDPLKDGPPANWKFTDWAECDLAVPAAEPAGAPRETALLNTLRDTIKEWLSGFLFTDGRKSDRWEEGHQAAIKQTIEFIENEDDTDDFSVKLSNILEAAKEEMSDEEMDIAEKIIAAAAQPEPQGAGNMREEIVLLESLLNKRTETIKKFMQAAKATDTETPNDVIARLAAHTGEAK